MQLSCATNGTAKDSGLLPSAKPGELSRLCREPARLRTRTGLEFIVRPARPDDRQGMAFLLTHMTPEDMYFRFLTPAHRVSNNVLEMMTNVDHDSVENLLAIDRDTHIPIASLLLAADENREDVEIAMAVQSHFKEKGLSWTLLEYAIGLLRDRGFKRLHSVELREHSAAINLEKEMGFTSRPFPDDPALTLLELDLGQKPA